MFERQGVWGTGAGFSVCEAAKAKQTEKDGHKSPNESFNRRCLKIGTNYEYIISHIVKDFPPFCRN